MENLTDIKGLGPKSLPLLEKLNIKSINDLVNYLPFKYTVLQKTNIEDAVDGDNVIVSATVASYATIRWAGRVDILKFSIETGNLFLDVVIFNRRFMKSHIKIGDTITIIGKFKEEQNQIVASNILLEEIDEEKIEVHYPLTSGISNKKLKFYIDYALENYEYTVPDLLPEYIKEERNFGLKKESLYQMHNPESMESINHILEHFKFEELFLFMLKIEYLKEKNEKFSKGLSRTIDYKLVENFIKTIPFELTNDQVKASNDIYNDLINPKRMNRLVSGDVGSGKTIVSFIAAYINYLSGYQTALMAPTEILAKQHFINVQKLLEPTGIKSELLVGSLSKKEKEAIYDRLTNGEIDLIVGTHALFQKKVEYKNLGLVITDEQHRFGVNQRDDLKNKGKLSDILYMSATPIPRTYALTIYGDMTLSEIKEKPKNRKEIKTYYKADKDMEVILKKMHQELKRGHQIYVVVPLVEESDKIELNNTDKVANNFKKAFGKYFTVDTLHGKMSSEEKETSLNKFVKHETDILISTTIIEVGVDVPNANMIIIFDAERFGLSTLHQLRGRVGRSDKEATCILISNKEKERLDLLTKTSDGFEIAEADFKMRGSGDLFGSRQSGEATFRVADLRYDYDKLIEAQKEAIKFIKEKNLDDYPELRLEINNIYSS